MLKLELGCGMRPTEGYFHHDRIKHGDHVDLWCDLRVRPWPFIKRNVGDTTGIGVSDLPEVWAGYHRAVDAQLRAGTCVYVIPPPPFVPEDAFIDEILALDVFEHVSATVTDWLDECWRLLVPGGLLDIRLPAWDHDLSYRDPTHLRVFHPESFYYWDPATDLHRNFGAIYFAESARWWDVQGCDREYNDFRFRMTKRA